MLPTSIVRKNVPGTFVRVRGQDFQLGERVDDCRRCMFGFYVTPKTTGSEFLTDSELRNASAGRPFVPRWSSSGQVVYGRSTIVQAIGS